MLTDTSNKNVGGAFHGRDPWIMLMDTSGEDGNWARLLSKTRSLKQDWVNPHAVNTLARLSSSLLYKQTLI
ncbi:uncharacterized [Tachysurus ichikawai]